MAHLISSVWFSGSLTSDLLGWKHGQKKKKRNIGDGSSPEIDPCELNSSVMFALLFFFNSAGNKPQTGL